MGKAKKELLNPILISHFNTIHDTLQLLDRAPPSTLEKSNWNEVIQMGDQLSKQATIVGMLWTGKAPEANSVVSTMESYFNLLQGFLLLCHGSMVGAGPTLSSSIHASAKQVVDSSFKLLQGSVSLHDGSYERDRKPSMPQLAGAVWEACSSLKKAPSSNVTAIGRAITQVAVSVKDVLREMKELKPASSCGDEALDDASGKPVGGSGDDENLDHDDLGNDLTPEEMEVARLAIDVVSETLAVVKELIRTISGLIKLENPKDGGQSVDSLENLLKLCRGIGVQIDELGACLYPPQEVTAIKHALNKVSSSIGEMHQEVESLNGSAEAFLQTCDNFRNSLKQMETGLDGSSTNDVRAIMQNVSLVN